MRVQQGSVVTTGARRERGRHDAVVQRAIDNVRANVTAMPASDVVQLALWPQTLAAWARLESEDESQLSNLFRRYRTYGRLRETLARRLEVPLSVLAHLIEARPALPAPYRRQRATPAQAGRDAVAALPPVRDGCNPIELAAVDRVAADCGAMPASRIVGLALWPETLTAWATATAGCAPGVVMTALSGLRRAPRAEIALARRLGVSARALDDFINSVKAPSVILHPAAPADRAIVGRDGEPVARGAPRTRDRRATGAPGAPGAADAAAALQGELDL